ncbi:glycoprotein [Boteke virus]|uniref:Glycoprotein n=1 Tax=Boteke virus TaxID=864698 RepID=A0AAE8XBJ7_9RHAB|nr:glycoprotein [Boteke virus]UAU42844.1 glycoprotein [Boteke virus]
MLPSTILLIVISIQLSVGIEYVYFPTQMKTDFKPVLIRDLSCPYISDDSTLGPSIKTTAKILKTNLVTESGKLCYTQKWITKCEENFFGVQTITHHIIDLPIDKHPSSFEENPTFPDPNCRWMSSDTTEKINTICKEESLRFDTTTGKGVDEQYGTFTCNEEFCRLDKYITFKPHKNVTQTYNDGFQYVEVEISLDPDHYVIPSSTIKSKHFPKMTFRNACTQWVHQSSNQYFIRIIFNNGFLIEFYDKYNLIDHKSVKEYLTKKVDHVDRIKEILGAKKSKSNEIPKFSDQKWININTHLREFPHTGKFIHLLSMLRTCEDSDIAKVKVPTLDFQTTDAEMYIESKIDQIFCKHRLYEIMTKGKISLNDLGLLAPNHGGVGPVYHKYKNDITRGIGIYRKIIWDPNPKDDVLGYYTENREKKIVKCPEWVNGSHALKWCVNGIFKLNNKIYHPYFSADNFDELIQSFMEEDVRLAEHNFILHNKNRNITTWEDYYSLTDNYSWKGFELSWLKGFKNIGFFVSIIFGTIISIMIMSLILKCVYPGRRRQNRIDW